MSQGEPLASPFGDVIFAYTRADAIRDELAARGITIKDTPQGVQIIRS